MNKGVSVYLDLLRILAAFAVLLGHAQGYILPALPKIIASHSEEGVAIFFVLSGFVIRFVSIEKERDWQTYAFARFTRLFSVIPIALAATFLADRIGLALAPSYYAGIPWYGADYAGALLHSLTFTNEIWAQSSTFGSNHAYWSMGFEVQYYILFALVMFLPRRWAVPAALAWALVVGPTIAIYLSLWLMGVATFEIVRAGLPAAKGRKGQLAGLAMFGGSLVLYGIVKFGFRDLKVPMTEFRDIPSLLQSCAYYVGVALAVVFNILGANCLLQERDVFSHRMVKAVRWIAGGTFTLYLVHQPLLTLARAAIPDYPARPLLAGVVVLAITAVCYLLAELGERRKHLYKRAFLWVGQLWRSQPREGMAN
ncbi:acyltransferase family protein [Croceicoccus mobilis]|uniref:Acyltransferase n=1 Tax=Croceicoccus mobilis TaxID=1703339 RepID=A0A916YSC8_9SPHN|nr:acyltransferase [Croceicoccus mobilis]GGD58257.1 acyltransferase [Croceicoccus mobilis]